MRADIDMDVAAFADEAHRAPHLGAADRVQPGLRIARGVERQIGVTSVGEILDGGHRIVLARIDRRIGPERLSALAPLRPDGRPTRAPLASTAAPAATATPQGSCPAMTGPSLVGMPVAWVWPFGRRY